MTGFFTAIPEGQAVIHANGIYQQVPLFQRGGRIYAKRGGGFVRLNAGGATSAPKVRWAELHTPNGQWAEVAGGHVEYIADEGAE